MHSSKLPAQDHGPAASSCAKPGAEGGCGGLCKPPQHTVHPHEVAPCCSPKLTRGQPTLSRNCGEALAVTRSLQPAVLWGQFFVEAAPCSPELMLGMLNAGDAAPGGCLTPW